jgi:hypothetical protein
MGNKSLIQQNTGAYVWPAMEVLWGLSCALKLLGGGVVVAQIAGMYQALEAAALRCDA